MALCSPIFHPTQQLSYFLLFEHSLSLLLSLSPVPALSLALSYPLKAQQAPYLFWARVQHSFLVGMQETTSRSGEGAQWMGSPSQGQPREGMRPNEILWGRGPAGKKPSGWQERSVASPSYPLLASAPFPSCCRHCRNFRTAGSPDCSGLRESRW